MMRRCAKTAALLLAAALLAPGCYVSTEKYVEKVHEGDALRDALAAANKDRNALTARNEALQKQLSDQTELAESLASKVKSQEKELTRLGTELGAAKKSYEGNRITREELINQLLEKEKETGKRIQTLVAKSLECDAETERLKKEVERVGREIAARDSEIDEMRKKLEKAPSEEAVRIERDQLLGKVERLTEDRVQAEKRRDSRFEAAVASLGKEESGKLAARSAGPVLRIPLPEKDIVKDGDEPGAALKAVVAEAVAVSSDFPEAAFVLRGPEGKALSAVSAALSATGKIPAAKLFTLPVEKGGLEMLVIAP